MKLDKAIEILTTATDHEPRERDPEIYDAVRLALEALTFIRGSRTSHQIVRNMSLPGETPEDAPDDSLVPV